MLCGRERSWWQGSRTCPREQRRPPEGPPSCSKEPGLGAEGGFPGPRPAGALARELVRSSHAHLGRDRAPGNLNPARLGSPLGWVGRSPRCSPTAFPGPHGPKPVGTKEPSRGAGEGLPLRAGELWKRSPRGRAGVGGDGNVSTARTGVGPRGLLTNWPRASCRDSTPPTSGPGPSSGMQDGAGPLMRRPHGPGDR